MKTYIDLSEALFDAFKEIVRTDDEYELQEDVFVKKRLKEVIGVKEFKKFDAMDEKYWKDAWREFDVRTFVKEVKS